jgi:ADP-ribosylation factor-like protein 2
VYTNGGFTHHFSTIGFQKLAGSSLLIFANKQDLGGALSFEQIAEYLDLHSDSISGRHWKILGCSAMSAEGLSEGFDWLVDDISSRIFLMS